MNTPVSHEQSPQNNDEIDLLKLFKATAATWKYWLIALIIVSAVYGAVKAFQISALTQEITYSKPIRLTFPNAHKLKFPSGARFAYNDIVSPSVIRIAYDRNNIKDYNVSIGELQAALTAAPYSPQYPLIIKRYSILTANKKLTPDQVTELQKQMEQEIEQATSGEALISLRLEKKELPKDVANKLLNDIPAIWAENAVKQKGVLKVNVQLASANSINKELILNEDPLIASDIINEKLQALKLNINKLGEFEGAQPITDPVTGMKIQDLTYAVEDMGNYLLGGFLAPARELGLTDSPQKTIYYYQDRIKKLNLQLNALNKRASSVKAIYDSYAQNSPASNTPVSNNNAAISEINLDLVDKLVSLSGDTDRQKYRQRLNAEWIKLIGQISDLELTIQDAEQILASVKKSATTQQTADHKNYLELARKEIPMLLDKLISFYDVSERVYTQLSIESVGVKDQLYIPVTHTVLSNRNLIDVKATIITWIALLFLTTIVVIPGVMVRNALKAKA
ncbi:MAG: hypothetical protein B0W54_13650 [Cellvibrio sp. 79]|nr:MAG: hypothetical protein B0W54_13650 [Cellvibrio sp. 79]